ncbi:uncharacterized protein SCHCODRAFT_02718945 [Schizophyllum commune H4-8]|uniref:uncharacterized protein n=1 Tax=Schizophyllum commune (strain H4-8 / FGSC 9210) TaxID=578458 RepID=UPI00215EC37C|nr:uncharacterized protein SCHCODRAFT_02718945 [Schizophyllum commune H4-8]KAI5885344.1 hypothetical protein SCHCODRAFT_02718945 [Schizophyllum commune H4-8]
MARKPKPSRPLPARYDDRPMMVRNAEDTTRKRNQDNRDRYEAARQERLRADLEAAAAAKAAAAAAREAAKVVAIDRALDLLKGAGVTLGEFMQDTLGDRHEETWRYHQFYKDDVAVNKVIVTMASKKNRAKARRRVESAMLEVIAHVVEHEATAITKSGALRPPTEVNQDFVLGFKFTHLVELISPECPSIVTLMRRIVQTPRQTEDCSEAKLEHKEFITSMYTALLLGERSQHNSWFRHVFGLYLYSEGASRQLITVLNHLGITVSYVTLAGGGALPALPETSVAEGHEGENEPVEDELDDPTLAEDHSHPRVHEQGASGGKMGTLQKLSLEMRKVARRMAKKNSFLLVYDNINMMWRVAEQIVGRTGGLNGHPYRIADSMQNGTCATALPLFNAKAEDLRTSTLEKRFDDARELQIEDLLLTPQYYARLRKLFVHCVMRIIVRRGGQVLQAKFGKKLKRTEPRTNSRIAPHTTSVHPLPARPINENSKTGNADVIREFMEELGQPTTATEFADEVRLVAGDQLSMARLREVGEVRAGNEGGASSLRHILFTPGLFHYRINATTALLLAYLGKKNRDISNPASLHAHNTILRRKPIVATSLPSFRTSEDVINESKDARILDCALRVSGKASLAEHVADPDLDWATLKGHAEAIVDRYADARVAERYRRERERGNEDAGDQVFESAVLFLRDALLLQEFKDAIKSGDSGRVLTVLESWVFSYRGLGRVQYANEVLILLHNYKIVWPKKIRDILLQNWLVNTTGRPDGFLEVDRLQEHLNYWIKNYFQAHGSNASWKWLGTISPCVVILRSLSNEINSTLGARQGKRHATPDRTKDIDELMASLARHKVYEYCPGRRFDADDTSQVDDVIAVGLNKLMKGGAASPLAHHNASFKALQAAYRIPPLIGTSSSTREATEATNHASVEEVRAGAAPATAPGSPSLAAAIDEVMDRPHIEVLNNEESLWAAMEREALADFAGEEEDPYAPDVDADWAPDEDDDIMSNKDTDVDDLSEDEEGVGGGEDTEDGDDEENVF